MKYILSPEFGAFRRGEPIAYKVAERAMNHGLDKVKERVVVNEDDNTVLVYLEGIDDPFVFHWVEV